MSHKQDHRSKNPEKKQGLAIAKEADLKSRISDIRSEIESQVSKVRERKHKKKHRHKKRELEISKIVKEGKLLSKLYIKYLILI